MRLHKLKLAIGALLGAGAMIAGPAQALAPSDWDGTELNIYYSGATATDGILENNFLAITGGICAPGTIDIYRVSVSNRGNRVIFCRVTSNEVGGFPAPPLGRKVAFHKESIGGSSNAVIPLIAQTNLQFFNMAVANTCTDSGLVGPTADLRQYRNWTACPDNTVNRIPNGGISDTEPNLAFPTPTAAQVATLVSTPGVGVIFGVPVTLKLYRALQVAQGLAQNDTLATVPSLTRSQVRGLYQQKILNWSQLVTGAGASIVTGAPNPPVNAAQGGGADDRVFICRRVNSSGTQAAAETYWLQGRCDAKFGSTTSPGFAGGNGASMDTGVTAASQGFNSRVTPSEGSGDVRTCLNTHDTNGTWAIGVHSTEVAALGSFRMVRIDGAAPNLASVANGDYDYFTENTLNRRATGQTGAPTGETLTLLQFIEANIGKPSLIKFANGQFEGRPWGDGGVLALAGPTTFAPNAPPQVDGATGAGTMRENPVNTLSRSLVSSKVNNCVPPVMLDPSPTP